MENKGEIIIYQTQDGLAKIEVQLQNDTVWLTQEQMAALFQRDARNQQAHPKRFFGR